MESLVILGLLGLMIAMVTPGLVALRKRTQRPGELEFWRLLRRQGVGTPEANRALATAVRRCALCTNVETCHEWLAGRAGQELEDFCPNARYVERLERP